MAQDLDKLWSLSSSVRCLRCWGSERCSPLPRAQSRRSSSESTLSSCQNTHPNLQGRSSRQHRIKLQIIGRVRIIRDEDMTSCGVWNTEKETKENFIIWSVLVAVPMIIGPILTVIMEFILYLGKKCSKVLEYHNNSFFYLWSILKSKQPETPGLMTYWVIILLSASVIAPLLSLHLWLTEFLIELEYLVRSELDRQLIQSIISLERRLCNWSGLEVFLRESGYISGPLHHRHRRPCLEARI